MRWDQDYCQDTVKSIYYPGNMYEMGPFSILTSHRALHCKDKISLFQTYIKLEVFVLHRNILYFLAQ